MATENKTPLHVLIVGGGIGGLTLAILLERAGISYQVFEKSSTMKPLGSAISMSSQVYTFLQQLGIYEELHAISKPFQELNVHTFNDQDLSNHHPDNLRFRGTYNHGLDEAEKFHFETRMTARPDLCNVLIKHIPSSKILMSKKIISVQQNIQDGVVIRAQDGTVYHGDLIIGADGCYSPVRQSIYQELLQKNLLPKKDQEPINFDTNCVVGVTKPLNPEQYSELKAQRCAFQVVLFKNQPVSIWYMPLTDSRLGWMVNEQIPKEKIEHYRQICLEKNFAAAEWGPDAAIEMCSRFKNHPTPYGTLFGDLLENTPKELISKVTLEEKFFETWQDGRACLIGDACHKTLPFGAQGATNAMLDALALANRLYDMPSNSYTDIRTVLKDYESHRKAYGKAAVESSTGAGKLFHTQGIIGDSIRYLVLNLVPRPMIAKGLLKLMEYRPMVTFLPFVKDTGSAFRLQDEYSVKYLKKKQQLEKEE